MADTNRYDALKLENQLCFPLYAAAKELVRLYTPHLEPLGLTYTQYITMMLLWETPCMTSRQIGKRLFLDSGTLTPLLKKLEEKGLLTRRRDREDERNLLVELTEQGLKLRERAVEIPQKIGSCLPLMPEEAARLYALLYKILNSGKEAAD